MHLEVYILMAFCTLPSSKYYKHCLTGHKSCESAQAPAEIPNIVIPAAGWKEPHSPVRNQLEKATNQIAGSSLSLGEPPSLRSIFSSEDQKKALE